MKKGSDNDIELSNSKSAANEGFTDNPALESLSPPALQFKSENNNSGEQEEQTDEKEFQLKAYSNKGVANDELNEKDNSIKSETQSISFHGMPFQLHSKNSGLQKKSSFNLDRHSPSEGWDIAQKNQSLQSDNFVNGSPDSQARQLKKEESEIEDNELELSDESIQLKKYGEITSSENIANKTVPDSTQSVDSQSLISPAAIQLKPSQDESQEKEATTEPSNGHLFADALSAPPPFNPNNSTNSPIQKKDLKNVPPTKPFQLKEKDNNTGLPDDLKSGVENLSGYSLDDVKVNYNSDKPAQLNAHAYAQGTDIHVASGQEKHLPHEAWHVVQQKQGRVKPTKQMKGKVPVNDDEGLEKEADLMGAKATSQRSQKLGSAGDNQGHKNLVGQLKPATQTNDTPIMRKPLRERPTLLPLKPVGPDTVDNPGADSSQAEKDQYEQLNFEIGDLRLKIFNAQDANHHPTRADWYRRANSMNDQLDTTGTTEVMDSIRTDFDDLAADMWDAAGAPADEWSTLKDEAALAAAEMLSLADVEGIYAFDYLMKKFKQTSAQMQRIDEQMRLREDFVDFAEVIGTREYESHGKLRAARERFRELMQMLDTVGDLRGSGEDADEIIPGWEKLVDQEIDILIDLAGEATAITHTQRFSILQGRLQNAKQSALSRKPKKMGFLEKGDAFSRGVIGAVVNPFVEAAKQGVDLVKITAFTGYKIAGGDGWVPELYSDMAEHVDKTGAGTLDLLKGIPVGLIETPKRCFDAIKNGDWKAIGEMSANLFMLVHAARKGPARVKKLPGDVKRAAVQALKVYRILKFRALSLRKGPGMSQAAMKAVQKIAVEHGLEISFRPVSRTVTKLRRKGHPGKPEHLKMKTIDELDVHLGANKADIGKVGYFKPLDQPNISGLSSAKVADVYKQLGKRRREYWRLKDDVNRMVADGKIELRNGVVFEKGGKAYTGDHDAFSFTHDGKDISFEKLRAEVRNKLKADPIHTEHGAALSWDPMKPGLAEYYANNILKHRKGGERLVVFKPDGTIAREFFDD